MKRLLLRSVAIALILAPCSGLITYIVGISNITEYRPPFSEPELRQMDSLTVKQVQALTAARTVRITRTQWLAESLGSAYFWHEVAMSSIAPFAAIFLGCVCIGGLERRKLTVSASTSSATSFERRTPE